MQRLGFEETQRDAVDVIDLELAFQVNPQWNLHLCVRNAFDEDYFATADELSIYRQ